MDPGTSGWPTILRLRRRNPAVFNPAVIGYELTQKLDATQARQVLDGLSGSEASRRDVIGRLWTTEATRSLAEALADPDVDGAGMAQVIESLRLLLRT